MYISDTRIPGEKQSGNFGQHSWCSDVIMKWLSPDSFNLLVSCDNMIGHYKNQGMQCHCFRNVGQSYQTVYHHGAWQSGDETRVLKTSNYNTY